MMTRWLTCIGVLMLHGITVCSCATVSPARHYPDMRKGLDWPYTKEYGAHAVEYRFNRARSEENRQLGTRMPPLILPPVRIWDGMSYEERAFWLVNRERTDRGLLPLQGIYPGVTAVSKRYASYLMEHEEFGHYEDGRSPWQRLHGDPAIRVCHDFLGVAENLAIFYGGWTLPVERAVYMWMYDDGKSGWGHRHALLWEEYTDNSGVPGREGFAGVGVAVGRHKGWPDSMVIVMNFFDPCVNWQSINGNSR